MWSGKARAAPQCGVHLPMYVFIWPVTCEVAKRDASFMVGVDIAKERILSQQYHEHHDHKGVPSAESCTAMKIRKEPTLAKQEGCSGRTFLNKDHSRGLNKGRALLNPGPNPLCRGEERLCHI